MAFPSDQSLCLQYAYIVIIGRALSNMDNGKSRHINRRHIITISQLLSVCVISLDYVTSKDNIADPQTLQQIDNLPTKNSVSNIKNSVGN